MRDMVSEFSHFGRSAAEWMLFQTKWTECLHGAGSLREALSDLLELSGGRVILICRSSETAGRHRVVSSLDRGARAGERPITMPLGPSILRASARGARPGTLWTLGDLDPVERDRLDERAVRWMADRRFRDVAVLPLDRSGSDLDLMEIHFPTVIPASLRGTLEVAAAAASAAWRRRQKGRIARLLSVAPALAERLSAAEPALAPTPLSPANPLGLTAAETRICVLFRDGHPMHDLARQLRISESTLRTHLRSIYAKAGVGGQVDLVRLLLATGSEPQARLVS
jgi:DNA-binding CsgD family transcriptional regulator